MKQFQTIYRRKHSLTIWLKQILSFCEENNIPKDRMLFRIFSDSTERGRVEEVIRIILEAVPDAAYAGSTSTGNIVFGSLVDAHVSITCTVYEASDAKICILQLPMDRDTQASSAERLIKAVEERPWVKAVEIMTTLSTLNMESLCGALSDLSENIQVYGGGAHTTDMKNGDSSKTFVFSSAGPIACYNAVFILLGGDSLSVTTRYLIGWKQLGASLPVTEVDGNFLKSVDDIPARTFYEKYLGIQKGKDFFRMANVFPLGFRSEGIPYLRIVTDYPDDGSLKLSSYVKHDVKRCAITYGSPVEINKKLRTNLQALSEFAPEVIQLFSCAARLFFWGAENVSHETLPFSVLGQTGGYYTAGELLRCGKEVLLHNIALVIVGLREGEPSHITEAPRINDVEMSRQMRVSNCLANFIEAMTEEK